MRAIELSKQNQDQEEESIPLRKSKSFAVKTSEETKWIQNLIELEENELRKELGFDSEMKF